MPNTPPPAAHQTLKEFTDKQDGAVEQPVIPAVMLPGVADKVREFLMSKGAKLDETATPPPVERVKVDADPVFSEPNPEETAVQSALVDIRAVTVTEDDKALFMKAMLCDEPITLKIQLFGGRFSMVFRSRTMHEQRRVLDALRLAQKSGELASDDPALLFTRLQQYFTAMMLRSINDETFSDLNIVPGKTVDEDAKAIQKVFVEKLEGMHHIRWAAVLNGLRIFEEKCRQLSENCANEDFWKPQG